MASPEPKERRVAKPKTQTAGAQRPSLERYDVIEVGRASLTGAPYNPRTMDDKARAKLATGIQKLGLLAPIIWNAKSGHVVGGHQRLSIMDDYHGGKDYTLRVARVELDDKSEREANVLLNNHEAMGEFDLDKLAELFSGDIDLEATGFDAADIYRLLGDAPGVVTAQAGAMEELGQKVREAKEQYEAIAQTSSKRDVSDFYVVVVFRDAPDRDAFLAAAGLDCNRFQDGRRLRQLILGAQGAAPPAPMPCSAQASHA